MKRIVWGIAVAITVAAGLASAPAQAQDGDRMAQFTIGGVAFEMPIPDGYCLPTGTAAYSAAFVAETDSENETLQTFYPCDNNDSDSPDYYVVKVPRRAVSFPITLDFLLPAMEQTFEDPAFLAGLKQVNPGVSAEVSEASRQEISITGDIEPSGVDDSCAYLIGTLRIVSVDTDYERSIAACMTATGSRMVVVYRYADETRDPLTLKPIVKAVAATIRAVEPD